MTHDSRISDEGKGKRDIGNVLFKEMLLSPSKFTNKSIETKNKTSAKTFTIHSVKVKVRPELGPAKGKLDLFW